MASTNASVGPAFLGPGERVVFYEWCVSLLFVTVRRPSRLYRLRAEERGIVRGLPYTLVTLVFGWWGVPWGLVHTPLVLWTNLTGGRVITQEEWTSEGLVRGEDAPCVPS
jgi:hypothetical protein